MPDQGSSKSGQAKMRAKNANGSATLGRPRPKTIHVDSGSDPSRALTASRGKQGSGTNLAGISIARDRSFIQFDVYLFYLYILLDFFFVFIRFTCFVAVSFVILIFATESKPEARGVTRGSNPSLNRRGSNTSLHTAAGKITTACSMPPWCCMVYSLFTFVLSLAR